GRIIKLKRMALGCMGAVKLWPANGQLTVGEGLETVLSACTRLSYGGASLIPAWALISSGKLAVLPVLPDVQRITVLVDHDLNGEGQAAAQPPQPPSPAPNPTPLPPLPHTPATH